jgi:pantoate--beta-alanine ligase
MFALNLNKIPMPIFYGKAALIDYLKSIKTQNSTIGFVPTMVHYIKDIFLNATVIEE